MDTDVTDCKKIPAINSENKKELLKKSNFIQLKDSLDLYLMQIKDVLFQKRFSAFRLCKTYD